MKRLNKFSRENTLVVVDSDDMIPKIHSMGFSYVFTSKKVNHDAFQLKHVDITDIVMLNSDKYKIHKEIEWKLKNYKEINIKKYKTSGRKKKKVVYKYNDGTTHIVLFSGGLGSYFTAKRLLETGVKKENIILLYTDTRIEDPDLYRFMKDAEKSLGISITEASDGRDIWEVFRDVRYLGNSRRDPCSHWLKRKQSREFIHQYNPNNVIVYLGYDYTELHRLEKAQKAWMPYKMESPLCDKPYLDKEDMKKLLADDGIELPKLYKLGFSHNNCGGGCVKAGIGHFTMLYETMPDVFQAWEENEQMMRDYLKRDISILRRTRNGVRKNFTLKHLREEIETITEEERCDIGGCGCFSGDD